MSRRKMVLVCEDGREVNVKWCAPTPPHAQRKQPPR
jgi:hypothetical protein